MQDLLTFLGRSPEEAGKLWPTTGISTLMQKHWGSAQWRAGGCPGGCHLGARPGPTLQTLGSSAGMCEAKKPTGREHSLTHQQT